MRYIGGKQRQAQSIREAVFHRKKTRTRYVEPFIGGGSVFAAVAPLFQEKVGGDLVPDLVLLWEALRDGWEPPTKVSRDEYEHLLQSEPSALRAWVGFAASYNGRWWGGYGPEGAGRDYLMESFRTIKKKARHLDGASFLCCSYGEHSIDKNTVVYCDPPYQDDTGNSHGGRATPDGGRADKVYGSAEVFDHGRFWKTMETWDQQGALVLVHEYTAPPGWVAIQETERTETMNHRRGSSGTRAEVLWTPAANEVSILNFFGVQDL